MLNSKSISTQPMQRLTGVGRAAKRLNTTGYTVLKLIGAGKLTAEMVDGEVKPTLESIERYERELAQQGG